jgi:hypothetical protein
VRLGILTEQVGEEVELAHRLVALDVEEGVDRVGVYRQQPAAWMAQ